MKHFSGNISSRQHCAYNPRWQHHFTVPIRGQSLMTSHLIYIWCCLLSVDNALSTAWFIINLDMVLTTQSLSLYLLSYPDWAILGSNLPAVLEVTSGSHSSSSLTIQRCKIGTRSRLVWAIRVESDNHNTCKWQRVHAMVHLPWL